MRINLPNNIGYGRLEFLLKILSEIKKSEEKQVIELDWSQVTHISPAGYALLACLFDAATEHQCKIVSRFIKKTIKQIPVINNLNRACPHLT